jgi:hypothetical protein
MKIKTIQTGLLTLLVSLILISCHREWNQYYKIQNNSSKAIYYRFSYAFPDTTLKKSDPNNYKVNSGQQISTSANNFSFNSTIQIFIFDADVIEKEPWDSIVLHGEILKRYQFTEIDMKNDSWTITYPN